MAGLLLGGERKLTRGAAWPPAAPTSVTSRRDPSLREPLSNSHRARDLVSLFLHWGGDEVGPRSPGLRDLAGRQVRHSRKLRRAPIRSEFGKMRYNYSREVMVDGKGFVPPPARKWCSLMRPRSRSRGSYRSWQSGRSDQNEKEIADGDHAEHHPDLADHEWLGP